MMPTNETRKGQLIFSGQQSRSTEMFGDGLASTIKLDKRIPVTSAFTEMILVDQRRDAKDAGLKVDTGKLCQAFD